MMENKVYLKRYLVVTVIMSSIIFAIFLIVNIYEYHTYKENYNKKLESIVFVLKQKYPEISDDEIIGILNDRDKNDFQDESKIKDGKAFLEKYGIYSDKDALLQKNENFYHMFLILNSTLFIFTCAVLLLIFLKYDAKKDKEIKRITKYIEEINRKNYSLQIDDISEDELSILKNEIYKTTIMLKENADNSLKDKRKLKNSLEDISHQLKTPLTSILIILDNIIDDPDMDRATRDDFARDIKREVTKISFLVQALLKLSKFDSNTVNFSKDRIDVKKIVGEAIKNVWSLCDIKNIKINIVGNENIDIQCDFMWQIEAITNILKNAIEHSDNNSEVFVKYEQNNVYTSIDIQNFGQEIDEEDLPHIFERFYKGKNATENSVGIGLALAKVIVEKDNGTIVVESDNSSTRFIVKYFNF